MLSRNTPLFITRQCVEGGIRVPAILRGQGGSSGRVFVPGGITMDLTASILSATEP